MPCAAGVLIAGDDFKSGQTKIKSVLVDFLVGAGIKPTAIVSYNHLGNNDGMNLSAPQTFRSKEISKSNVVCAPPGAAHARARGGGRGGGTGVSDVSWSRGQVQRVPTLAGGMLVAGALRWTPMSV